MYTSEVERSIPIPVHHETDYMTLRDRAETACNAAKLLLDLGAEWKEPDHEGSQELLKLAVTGAPTDKVTERKFFEQPENVVHLREIISAYDMIVVHEASQIRNYVTNKLIIESTNNDPKIRIQALRLLGQITDVGLFTEKSEVTITNRSTTELENKLREKLSRLSGKMDATDAIVTQTTPLRDVDLNAEMSDD